MRLSSATVLGLAFLLMTRVGAAQQTPEPTTAPIPPTAKPFYVFGFRCGKGTGLVGLVLGPDGLAVGAHLWENPLAGDLTNATDALRRLLAILSVLGITNSDADDAQMARARCPLVAEAYRLFSLLQKAPPDEQAGYVEAFEAGHFFGRRARSWDEQAKLPAAATEPPPIEPKRRAGTDWRRDRKARPLYRFALASPKLGGWPYEGIPSLMKRYAAHVDKYGIGDVAGLMVSRTWTPHKSRLYLSMFYGADANAPDVRRARARRPLMKEARRLYQVLKNASPRQQSTYAAAFQDGLLRGDVDASRKLDADRERERAAERAAERRRLHAHRHLTRALLARTPDQDLGEAIMDYVSNKIDDHGDRAYEIVTSLPKPIQWVYAMFRMNGEIDGIMFKMQNEVDFDGFQHLLTCDSWRFASLAEEGYRLVGARKRAAVMKHAIAVIAREKAKAGSGATPSKEECEDGNAAFAALSKEFYEADRTENMYRLIARYIRQHPEQFVAK
jgi:hypothetical protein